MALRRNWESHWVWIMANRVFDPTIFDPAIFDTGEEPSFASVDWTGVEQRLAADPATVDEIRRRIAELDVAIEKAGLTNVEQSKAKAITTALRSLVESPEPEWQAIVLLLTSPTMQALCNALALGAFLIGIVQLISG